jgi:hypothetical protein
MRKWPQPDLGWQNPSPPSRRAWRCRPLGAADIALLKPPGVDETAPTRSAHSTPVFKPEDFDAIKGRCFLPPGPPDNMIAHGRLPGLRQSQPITYRKAVEKAAPPRRPTACQKAAWDEAKAKNDRP